MFVGLLTAMYCTMNLPTMVMCVGKCNGRDHGDSLGLPQKRVERLKLLIGKSRLHLQITHVSNGIK